MSFLKKLFGGIIDPRPPSSPVKTESFTPFNLPPTPTAQSSPAKNPVGPVKTSEPNKLLIAGVRSGSIETVNRALDAGADINVLIDETAPKGQYSHLQTGDMIDTLFPTVQTSPLEEALKRGNAAIVRLLLQKGACLRTEMEGRNPWDICLCEAAKVGRVAICAVALEQGANVNCSYLHRATPLILASSFGHEGVVRFLLEKKADYDAWSTDPYHPGKPYRTAQMWASAEGHHGIAQILGEAAVKKSGACQADVVPQNRNPALDKVEVMFAPEPSDVIPHVSIPASRLKAQLRQGMPIDEVHRMFGEPHQKNEWELLGCDFHEVWITVEGRLRVFFAEDQSVAKWAVEP